MDTSNARSEVGGIMGADISSHEMQTRLDTYVLRNELRLPFAGTWKAVNAGRTPENKHFTNRNQRFAVDWIKVDSKGCSHTDACNELSSYYCYGEDVLAVADGIVNCIVDGVPEHLMAGSRDHYNVPGNQIVLDLGKGEFAFYAHLIPGEMKVKVGDHVYSGQPLGKVGNSGNSTEPHLHFQVMDMPRLTEAASMPLKFSNVWLNGLQIRLAEINDGDILAPQF